jgi:hypothetical protein
LTGNVTIIVPPTIQIYYVQNATTGSASNFTVKISTNTGNADATISAGQQSTLICDSQNLVNANTVVAGQSVVNLTDGSVGAPSLYFGSEPTTGVYRAAAGKFDIGILGVNRVEVSATGMAVAGTGNFTSGVLGGTF